MKNTLPILPLRDIVVFPSMIVPLFVGRDKSVRALEEVMAGRREILLLTQQDERVDDPAVNELYHIGILGNLLQLLKLPDGTIKVLVEGSQRVQVDEVIDTDGCLRASFQPLPDVEEDYAEQVEISQQVMQLFEQYVKLNRKLPPEVLPSLVGIEDLGKLADTIATHLGLKLEDKQKVLETTRVSKRLALLSELIDGELDILQVDKRVRVRVKRQMEKSQRDYYLGEQMKAIQKELDEGGEQGELDELEGKIEALGLSAEAKEKAHAELKRLRMMPPMSSEATVVRNYLDWLLELPWKKRSRTRRDLKAAAAVLDAQHYGLEKVKERILEQLAVLQLVRQMKGSILCLVGPPGVGKTSLAKSIAEATKRKYVRMSLCGMRDEAEIRGHRRTYIGSLPGKIIQSMKKAKVKNPLILLDEIDKLGADFRGDPSSALLEVLDPEQNHTFNDHYLEVDYDLSEVMFITTANSMNIPGPLRDRMEIIRVAGYSEEEKMQIAIRYLLPKACEDHGLKSGQLKISDGAIRDIIRYYTSEAGVRNIKRMLAKICRKTARSIVQDGVSDPIQVTEEVLDTYLGVRKYKFGIAESEHQIGMVTGLAWTEVGGELLQIETVLMPGKGKLTVTGQLGDVMKESIEAAFSYVRSRAVLLGLKPDFHQKIDVHVHVPEGAIPKDGPSAGLAMATSIISSLTGIPVRSDVCMTGEITLRGKALQIGGLKEKLLAALRGGLSMAIIPEENRKDLKELPKNITDTCEIRLVSDMDQVLEFALVRLPAEMKGQDGFVPQAVSGIYLNEDLPTAH
ncbi:MAG: endopeptidase La [Mariprofundaceae bacterium]